MAWTKRIARLYEEQLEDYDNALRWYGKVFQEAPTEHQSSEQLLRLAGKLDRWKDVGHLFSDYLASELGDSPEVLDITRRAAEIFDLRLGDREEARKYYRRLHETRPDDREVALLFENALERWESWLELRELVDEQAGRAVEPAVKKAFLRRSAKLDEERLEDKTRAMRTLREIVDLELDTSLLRRARPRRRPSSSACCATTPSGTTCRRTWRSCWSARPTRATATRSRCAWPTCWRSASTICRAPSIATPRSWSARPGTARRSRRSSGSSRTPTTATAWR